MKLKEVTEKLMQNPEFKKAYENSEPIVCKKCMKIYWKKAWYLKHKIKHE